MANAAGVTHRHDAASIDPTEATAAACLTTTGNHVSYLNSYWSVVSTNQNQDIYPSVSPDYCGIEKQTFKAIDYWNSTKLETGEYLDKRINVTEKIEKNMYLTDDQG